MPIKIRIHSNNNILSSYTLIMNRTVIFALAAMLVSACAEPDHKDIYQELKSADKLVLASMSVTKTAKFESDNWYTYGKRIAVYSYDTYLRAYVDLSELHTDDIVFDETHKTVKVTLPPVMTEITGRDMQMRKEYENIGILRSELDSKERAEIKEKANASFKDEVENNPAIKKQLTETARRKARQYVAALFEAEGYTADIEFKP